MTRYVTLPAAALVEQFQLDFRKALELTNLMIQKESEEKINALMQLFTQSYDVLPTPKLVTLAKQQGLVLNKTSKEDKEAKGDEDAAITALIEDMRRKATRSIVEGGLTNMMIKEVLSNRLSSKQMSEKPRMSTVSDVVTTTNQFFSQFVRKVQGNQLALWLNIQVKENIILHALSGLYDIIRNGETSVVQCRESYALDALMKDALGVKLVETSPLLEAKAYKIESTIMNDVAFVEALSCFMWSLNEVAGIKTNKGEVTSYKLDDLVTQAVAGVGELLPFVPVEAGKADPKRMEEMYMQVYVLHIYMRLLRDQPGTLMPRVMNAINASKFFKLEETEAMLTKDLYITSLAFEAFLDTAAYFRELYHKNDVYFSDFLKLHPLKRQQIVAFVDKNVERFANYTVGLENPTYYRQMGHVMNHTNNFGLLENINLSYDFFRPDVDKLSRERIWSPDKKASTSFKLYTAPRVSGDFYDIYDADLPVHISMLRTAKALDPIYSFYVDVPNALLASAVVKHLHSIIPISVMDALEKVQPALTDIIKKRGVLRRFRTAADIAQYFATSMEVAELIYGVHGKDNLFYDITGWNEILFVLDKGVSDQFYIREHKTNRYVTPFIIAKPAIEMDFFEDFNIQHFGAFFKEADVEHPKNTLPGKGKKKELTDEEKKKMEEEEAQKKLDDEKKKKEEEGGGNE